MGARWTPITRRFKSNVKPCAHLTEYSCHTGQHAAPKRQRNAQGMDCDTSSQHRLKTPMIDDNLRFHGNFLSDRPGYGVTLFFYRLGLRIIHQLPGRGGRARGGSGATPVCRPRRACRRICTTAGGAADRACPRSTTATTCTAQIPATPQAAPGATAHSGCYTDAQRPGSASGIRRSRPTARTRRPASADFCPPFLRPRSLPPASTRITCKTPAPSTRPFRAAWARKARWCCACMSMQPAWRRKS